MKQTTRYSGVSGPVTVQALEGLFPHRFGKCINSVSFAHSAAAGKALRQVRCTSPGVEHMAHFFFCSASGVALIALPTCSPEQRAMMSLSQVTILTVALLLGTAWGAKRSFPNKVATFNDVTVVVENKLHLRSSWGLPGERRPLFKKRVVMSIGVTVAV